MRAVPEPADAGVELRERGAQFGECDAAQTEFADSRRVDDAGAIAQPIERRGGRGVPALARLAAHEPGTGMLFLGEGVQERTLSDAAVPRQNRQTARKQVTQRANTLAGYGG